MKKFAVAVLSAALMLSAPAAVGAGKKKAFAGSFKPAGTLQFDLKKTKKGKRVVNFEWDAFPLECDGGPKTSSGNLTFKVKVKKKEFSATAVPNADPKAAKLSLKGEFKGKRNAEGTMRLRGDKVPTDTTPDRCDSKHPWKASVIQ